jgi:signal peptidase
VGVGGRDRGRRWGLIVPIGALGLVILTPLAALLATTWVMGWRLQVVTTASMNPLYPAGTLVAVEPIDAAAIEPGMVIVFRDPGHPDRLVAHRVVKRWPGEPSRWQTQGDANRDPDPWPVAAEDVRGRVRWGVPGLGSVVSKLSGWRGAAILVGGPLSLLGCSELSVHIRRRRPQSDSDRVVGRRDCRAYEADGSRCTASISEPVMCHEAVDLGRGLPDPIGDAVDPRCRLFL